jgi:hypothetical protein
MCRAGAIDPQTCDGVPPFTLYHLQISTQSDRSSPGISTPSFGLLTRGQLLEFLVSATAAPMGDAQRVGAEENFLAS